MLSYLNLGMAKLGAGRLTNFSRSGIYIRSRCRLELGTSVNVRLSCGRVVRAGFGGRVVRIDADGFALELFNEFQAETQHSVTVHVPPDFGDGSPDIVEHLSESHEIDYVLRTAKHKN